MKSENVIVFQLNSAKKITYVVDALLLKDIRKRLTNSVKGVLKITDQYKVDLNQVDKVYINGHQF